VLPGAGMIDSPAASRATFLSLREAKRRSNDKGSVPTRVRQPFQCLVLL
jgi:hypothetical protein